MPRPRIYDEDRVATAVRLPASLHLRLREEGRQRDVSINYLIIRAIEHYLRSLPSLEEADAQ